MDQIAAYDDGTVMRIRAAGFIILGKTAASEVGSLPYTEPEGFAPARNPWNLDYTPGGSSGGAAAAVAAGLCAIAQGSDGGGSVRGPASCCGLVGIKPSRGRVSHAPLGDRLSGVATDGAIARTVADAAAFLDVISGYTTGDPYWLPDPHPSFLAAATNQLSGSLKIGFCTTFPPLGEAEISNKQAVLETAKLLEGIGHSLEPISFDLSELIEPFKIVWQSGVAASGIPKPALGKMNQWLLEQTGDVSKYLRAVAQMQIIGRKIVALSQNFDLLLLPVYMHPTIRVGEWENLSPEVTLEKIINWIAPCPPFNASGQPAIAIPAGFDSNGLPIGVQLVGRPAAEATIIALAAQIEAIKQESYRPNWAL
jgi:amidase